MVTCSMDSTLKLWSTSNGKVVLPLLFSHH
jgi:hypothetical protein